VKLGGTDLRAQRAQDGGYQLSGNQRVAFGTSYSNAIASTGGGDPSALAATSGVPSPVPANRVDTSSSFVNLPAVGLGGYNPTSFAVSLFSAAANRFLNLEISALEADGKGKVVSSPRVVTADQKEAIIEQGSEVTIVSVGPNNTTVTSRVKGVLSLKVTPRITPEGGIILSVEVTKNTIISRNPVEVGVKFVKTEILVENGGTVVIGGIFTLNETSNEAKVPLLGDLPGIGNLFKNRSRSVIKTEMLVFITPKIIAENSAAR